MFTLNESDYRKWKKDLTDAERIVFYEIAINGLKDREIAEKYGVTIGTVKTHVSHALLKLGVEARTYLPIALSRFEPETIQRVLESSIGEVVAKESKPVKRGFVPRNITPKSGEENVFPLTESQYRERKLDLSKSELVVLYEIGVYGLENQQIADRLYVVVGTIKTHVRSILSKLGLTSRSGIIIAVNRYDTLMIEKILRSSPEEVIKNEFPTLEAERRVRRAIGEFRSIAGEEKTIDVVDRCVKKVS